MIKELENLDYEEIPLYELTRGCKLLSISQLLMVVSRFMVRYSILTQAIQKSNR